MKKDINFLETAKQGKSEKQTNTFAIIIVIMLLVLGVLLFVFFNTKGKLNDINKEIAGFESEKADSKYQEQKDKMENVQSVLNTYINELLTKDTRENLVSNASEISKQVFNQMIDTCDKSNIKVNSIAMTTLDANSLIFKCETVHRPGDIDKMGKQGIKDMENFVNRLNTAFILDDNYNEILIIQSSEVLSMKGPLDEQTLDNVVFEVVVKLNITASEV